MALAIPAAKGAAGGNTPNHSLDPRWDVTIPRGQTREISFETNEGTEMSLDVSPDGRWILFDLLGEVYRLPSSGGAAQILTGDSGIALNFHPAFSPDGSRIAFVSDRSGQNNLWVMNADGSNPQPIFLDEATRISEPAWSPDGKTIVAVRGFPTPGRGWHRVNTQIWSFPLDGRPPQALVAGRQEQYNSPSFAPNGRSLYFHISYFAQNRFGTQVGHRLQKLDLRSHRVDEVLETRGRLPTWRDYIAADESLIPSDDGAKISPVPSPDGRWLAYAKEVPASFEFRGHRHAPSTALVIRDLATHAERVLLSPITKDLTAAHAMFSYRTLPGYAWSPDSKSIILTLDGKIKRLDIRSGRMGTIEFRAKVDRTISEMTRGKIPIDDEKFAARFLQWPTSSPDGTQLAFVAAGKIWIYDVASGESRILTPPGRDAIQLTPSWSPDGRKIAFAQWSEDGSRGHVWTIDASGSHPRRLTNSPGEYVYPTWRPDGQEIAVAAGQGPASGQWNGWDAQSWSILRLPAEGGAAARVGATAFMQPPSYVAGRIYFAAQDDPSAAADLHNPWPSEEALRQVTKVHSVLPDGSGPSTRVVFSFAQSRDPSFATELRPLVSPDGNWVAYDVDNEVYVAPLPPSESPQFVNTDPNGALSGARRVSRFGGAYYSWRNPHVLQFASGSDYVAYDVATGATTRIPINLVLHRDGGIGRIAFTNATIITVDGDKVISGGSIVVQGSRIACVGNCDLAGAGRIVDLKGKFVIPGLVDVHEHETIERAGIIPPHRPASLSSLAYGVTTIVDPATSSTSAFPLAEMIEAGVTLGPRTYSSAEIVIPTATAFGERIDIRSLRDAELAVNRRADWGAVTIKNYRNESRGQQQKLIAAARERQITITGEGGPLLQDLGVIMDGQTGWEHYIADLPVYRDFTRFAGAAGITYSPTVGVAGHGEGAARYFRPRHDFSADAKYRRFTPGPSAVPAAPAANPPPLENFSFPIVAEGLADIIRAGGHGAIGEHGEQYGLGSHWEIWSYATALTPLEALRIATLDGARFVGLEGEIGSITAGKIADLVILDADPLRDIHNTLRIAFVMKAGKLYESDTLNELWPRKQELGRLPWQIAAIACDAAESRLRCARGSAAAAQDSGHTD